jgi:hypothetical protein
MWARDLELCLGLWLAMSPFVFGYPDGSEALYASDFVCAAAIAALALLSYTRRARHAHLLELPVAAWLVGYGWVRALEAHAPSTQNHILVGLLVGMLANIPNHAPRPPESWRAPPGSA